MACVEKLWNTCYDAENDIRTLGTELDTYKRNLKKISADKTSYMWDSAWDDDTIKATQKKIDDLLDTYPDLGCKPCNKWLGLRRKEISSIEYSALPEFVKPHYAEKRTVIPAGSTMHGDLYPSRTEVTYVLKGGAKKRSTKSETKKSRKRMIRRRKTYRKQRGGGLKEDAIVALGKKYPGASLEDVLFKKGINNGDTFTAGEFTFKKYVINRYTYKIKAWKTENAEETAVDIVEVTDY